MNLMYKIHAKLAAYILTHLHLKAESNSVKAIAIFLSITTIAITISLLVTIAKIILKTKRQIKIKNALVARNYIDTDNSSDKHKVDIKYSDNHIDISPASRQTTTDDINNDLQFFTELFQIDIFEIKKLTSHKFKIFNYKLFQKIYWRLYVDTLSTQTINLAELITNNIHEEYKYLLGKNIHNTLSIDMSNNSSAIVYGQMGSGKTVLLRSIILQALNSNPQTQIIVISGTKGIGDFYNYSDIAEVLNADDDTDFERIIAISNKLKNEIKVRVNAYKELPPAKHHARYAGFAPILVIADEAKQYLCSDMYAEKEKKKKIEQLVSVFTLIATQGRSSGIQVIVALQEPQKNAIDINTFLFNIKISSNTDNDEMSRSLFGSTVANNPKLTRGLFVIKNPGLAGTVKFKVAFADEKLEQEIIRKTKEERAKKNGIK